MCSTSPHLVFTLAALTLTAYRVKGNTAEQTLKCGGQKTSVRFRLALCRLNAVFCVSQAMGVPHVLALGPRGSQCFLLLCLCCCCGDSYGLSRCKECT